MDTIIFLTLFNEPLKPPMLCVAPNKESESWFLPQLGLVFFVMVLICSDTVLPVPVGLPVTSNNKPASSVGLPPLISVPAALYG